MVGFDAGLDIDQSDVSGLSLCSEKILIYNIKSPQLRARVFWHMMYFDLVYMNKKVSVKIYELFSCSQKESGAIVMTLSSALALVNLFVKLKCTYGKRLQMFVVVFFVRVCACVKI